MTAGNTLGRAWSQLRAAVRGGLNVRAVTLACLSLGLAAESVKLFDVIRTMRLPSLEQPPAVKIARQAVRTDKIDLRAIASANLFGRYDPAPSQEPAADAREDLVLSGIFFYGGKHSLSRIMLTEYPQASFAVGDRVTGDVVVDAIAPRYAILSDGGRERILQLSWRTRNQRANAAGTGTVNGNFNDDLDANNDEPSTPPPVLEAYVDPVGDG
jgi:type II secretory pathway component PulC